MKRRRCDIVVSQNVGRLAHPCCFKATHVGFDARDNYRPELRVFLCSCHARVWQRLISRGLLDQKVEPLIGGGR
jgi:hypothetical protein